MKAIEDCPVEFTAPGGGVPVPVLCHGRHAEEVGLPWHVVDMLGNRGGIKLTVDGHNPLPPGTAHPVTLRQGPARQDPS